MILAQLIRPETYAMSSQRGYHACVAGTRGLVMVKRAAMYCVVGLLAISAFAKDKKKAFMSPVVLSAHKVAVIIEPGAGISIEDPRANDVARQDVETALLSWGRFEPVIGTPGADLIIVIRRATRRAVEQTIPDPRQNNRAGSINSIDNGVGIAAEHGPQPEISGPGGANQRSITPQTEISNGGDSFLVYDAQIPQPLDSVPLWRYTAQDGLTPHSVPAVAAFRKAIADAEKAAAKKP